MSIQRSKQEEEYFARVEAEKRARLQKQARDAHAKERAEEQRRLHFMHCGKCGAELLSTHFNAVEIEVCPGCGAVLLDPGELEQLVGEERSSLLEVLAGLFGWRSEL
jgi:hypothetical protein